MRQAVTTDGAPRAIGPYSQAVRAGQFVFVSGQIPLDPDTSQLASADIAGQTHRVCQNIGAILQAVGASFDHVVKTTIYLTAIEDFAAVNDVYALYFREPAPARATVQVARLPRDARIEVDAIAVIP